MFYFIIYTLIFTFTLAILLKMREDKIRDDMERDLKAEFKKKNGIK